MSNLPIKSGQDQDVFLKASGAGTNIDPNVVEHLESNSAEILAAVAAITGYATEDTQATILTSLDALLQELQLKANVNETQPVSLASSTLPTGASTSQLQTDLNTAFGQISANPWLGTGNSSLVGAVKAVALALGTTDGTAWNGSGAADLVELLKGIFGLLTGIMTHDLVDEGGVAISEANPLQVQIGQLLAAQDSVQANHHALGNNGIFIPVKIPTANAFNIAASMASNATATLVPAQAAGVKTYVHHIRISMEVASNVAGRMAILDGVGGTILGRFRMEPGKNTDLWFNYGTISTTAATALVLRNDAGAALTNLEWGVNYSIGA